MTALQLIDSMDTCAWRVPTFTPTSAFDLARHSALASRAEATEAESWASDAFVGKAEEHA